MLSLCMNRWSFDANLFLNSYWLKNYYYITEILKMEKEQKKNGLIGVLTSNPIQ